MNKSITIAAVGDIMPGDSLFYWGIGVKSLIEKEEVFLFKYVEKILSEADAVFGNLENVLCDCVKKHSYNDSTVRGNPDFVEQLKKAHFSVVNVANNHIQQHGEQPLFSTVDLLKQNGVNVVGIDSLHPHVMLLEDAKLGFVGYSLRPEVYADKAIYSKKDEKKILSDVTKIKEKVDYLAVSLHWGHEYVSFPASWQVNLAHKLIDNGTDIILGHHPHVLQGIEKYKRGIIAYSLGNFVSDMCQKEAKKTMILKLILENSQVGHEIIPCKINESYQPVALEGKERENALSSIEKLSNFPILPQEEYDRSKKNSRIRFRKQYYLFVLKKWYKYPIRNLIAIIHDFVRRRLLHTK